MATKKWTVADNRERLIGGAQAMADGLIQTYPELSHFEMPLVKALYDIGCIVGRHAASCGDHADSMPEAEPMPLRFSVYVPMKFGFVA